MFTKHKEIKILYDSCSEYYDNHYSKKSDIVENRIIKNELNQYHNHTDNILDIGCGTGLVLSLLNNRNRINQYLGIDLSPGMLSQAIKKHPTHHFINGEAIEIMKTLEKILSNQKQRGILGEIQLENLLANECMVFSIETTSGFFTFLSRGSFLFSSLELEPLPLLLEDFFPLVVLLGLYNISKISFGFKSNFVSKFEEFFIVLV